MQEIINEFERAKSAYDSRSPHALALVASVATNCVELLTARAQLKSFGVYRGSPEVKYHVYVAAGHQSRPFRTELLLSPDTSFNSVSTAIVKGWAQGTSVAPLCTQFIYTAVTAFSCVFDLWKPKSRKTPGTFFEVLVDSIAQELFPEHSIEKHVSIDDSNESVSTDLVIRSTKNKKSAIVPLKITTRERIVQPFAHQRILDSAYPNVYRSYLACISEVQRDDKTGSVNQVCVPGTIILFQKHLAQISGIYYGDIPQRYLKEDITTIIPVKAIGEVFEDIREYLSS